MTHWKSHGVIRKTSDIDCQRKDRPIGLATMIAEFSGLSLGCNRLLHVVIGSSSQEFSTSCHNLHLALWQFGYSLRSVVVNFWASKKCTSISATRLFWGERLRHKIWPFWERRAGGWERSRSLESEPKKGLDLICALDSILVPRIVWWRLRRFPGSRSWQPGQ